MTQAEEVVRDYVQRNFVDKGMCADWAIHDSENDKGQSNLHIHVLLTMRPLTEKGEWGAKQKKIYDLDENGERIPVIDKKTGQQKVDKRNNTAGAYERNPCNRRQYPYTGNGGI